MRRAIRARQPKRFPTVLSREEVAALLARLEGAVQLVVPLLYGTGMRILEHLGHKYVKTTVIYTHVLNKSGGRVIVSPADTLRDPGGACPSASYHPSCQDATEGKYLGVWQRIEGQWRLVVISWTANEPAR